MERGLEVIAELRRSHERRGAERISGSIDVAESRTEEETLIAENICLSAGSFRQRSCQVHGFSLGVALSLVEDGGPWRSPAATST